MLGEWGWVWLAASPLGVCTVIRRWGDVPDGGAFESEYLQIVLVADRRIAHVELFEMDDVDAAIRRFEELCPGGR